MKTTALLPALLALIVLASSCGYARNVRDDFLDIGTFAIGGVSPIKPSANGSEPQAAGFLPPAFGLYVQATDFFQAGALYKNTVDLEWDRRGYGIVADERYKAGFLFMNKEVRINHSPIYMNDYKTTGNNKDGWREHLDGLRDPIYCKPAKTLLFNDKVGGGDSSCNLPAGLRLNDVGAEPHDSRLYLGWQDWETFSVELGISEPFFFHTGIYLRAGFDPSQIFDFFVGLFCIDLYTDNAYDYWTGELLYQSDDS